MDKPLTQSKVLVIDDFQSMRAMLAGFLKGMGIRDIDSAGTAKEALSRLAAKKYDIVISDYNLGAGQNGQQVLEEAKHKKYIGYTTIWVMVTAEKTMDMFMGAAEARPDDYLLKPINEAMLEARFVKLMEKKKTLEPIEKAVKARDYMGAIALCDEQLKVHSANTPDLLRIKSDLLMTIGDLPAAKALFEKILAVRSIPWAKTGLGKVHFLSKEFLVAKEIFQEVLDENQMYLEAADWLAKTLESLGNLEQAQSVLANAMELSPNSSARQKVLADVAYKNGALDLAQASYEKAIKLGEYSVHKNSDTYAGLAKVLTDKAKPEEALKVIGRSREEFKDNPDASLQSAVVESMAYEKMGQPDKAVAALAEAEKLAQSKSGSISASVAMDMAKAMFKLGEKDKASSLLESVVQNNHDNEGLIDQIEAVFESEGLGKEGSEMIQKSTREIIQINDQGVILANEGKFEEGIKLLRKAVQNLPGNTLVITNLCGMLIGQMTQNGKDDRMVYETRELLERVRKIDPANKKLTTYTKLLGQLSSGAS